MGLWNKKIGIRFSIILLIEIKETSKIHVRLGNWWILIIEHYLLIQMSEGNDLFNWFLILFYCVEILILLLSRKNLFVLKFNCIF